MCVITLLAIIGLGSAFFWFFQKSDGEKNRVDVSDGTDNDTRLPLSSLVPTSTISTDNSIDDNTSTNIPKIPPKFVNETAIPTLIPTPFESAGPSATPSTHWSVERRLEFLITSIAPDVVPENFTDIPQTYFVNDTHSPQFAALNWMAATDMKTNVFGMTAQLLVERYVLAVLYFSTGGARTWTEFLSFLTSSNVCQWNDDHSIQKVIVSEGFRNNITEETTDYTPLKKGIFLPKWICNEYSSAR